MTEQAAKWKRRLLFAALMSLGFLLGLFAILIINQSFLRAQLENSVKAQITARLPDPYVLEAFHLEFDWWALLQMAQGRAKFKLQTPWFPVVGESQFGVETGQQIWSWIRGRHNQVNLKVFIHAWPHGTDQTESPWLESHMTLDLTRDRWTLERVHFAILMQRGPLPIGLEKVTFNGRLTTPLTQPSLVGQFEIDGLDWQQDQSRVHLPKARLTVTSSNCQMEIKLEPDHFEATGPDYGLKGGFAGEFHINHLCQPTALTSHGQLRLTDLDAHLKGQSVQVAVQEIKNNFSSHGFPVSQIKVESLGRQLEILKGEDYWDPPLEKLKLLTTFAWATNKEEPKTKHLQATWTLESQNKKKLFLRIDPWKTGSTQDGWEWQTRFNLSLEEIRAFLPPMSLAGWKLSGLLHGSLKGSFSQNELWQFYQGSQLGLQNLTLQHIDLRHSTTGAEVLFRLDRPRKWILNLNFPKIQQLNLVASIPNWSVPLHQDRTRLLVGPSKVPLTFKDLDFRTQDLIGHIDWQKGLTYQLRTGLSLPPTSLKKISELICLSPKITPDGSLELAYPKVELTENQVFTEGEGKLNVFDGQISISEFEIDQLLSPQPITFLSARWDNLQLERIGEFTQFGGMIGKASGHFKDVRFAGTLLNDYDFEFRLEPLTSPGKFYFSRRATQNLIEILAQGQGLSQGPTNSILKWSGRLLGDYGISYAGLRASTQRNFVILQTFDPPEVFKKERTHYLLYGSRIKMPLSTQTYPVILSKSGWNGFVYYFRDSLLSLMNNSNPQKDDMPSAPAPVEPEPHSIPCFLPPS